MNAHSLPQACLRVACGCVGLILAGGPIAAAEFKAGVGRVCITPPMPFWLSGYAARTNAAHEVRQELWAKALALEDDRGQRAVLVTTDLIGLPRDVTVAVARRVERQHGLARPRLALNASHTHCGPAVGHNLRVMFDMNAEDARRTQAYTEGLTDALVAVVGAALRDLAPATVWSGHGSVGFAINRREPAATGFRIGLNRTGPVDHDVPVLQVTAPDGRLRAVLFGYACHNTTLGGDFYQVNGDYAGVAQAEFERLHPGAAALFVMLCGGDQNPSPRGTVELVEQHGKALATEVERVLGTELRLVRPPVRTSYRETTLRFAPHQRAQFAQEQQHADRFRRRRATLMLQAYDHGRPVRSTPFPVQAISLGGDWTFLALGGEVVIDYVHRARREFPEENLITAGYCNDVMCYIPSRRVLREGGYEAVDSMIYYGQPGPFQDDVEERVFAAVHKVLRRVGAVPRP